MYQLILKKSNFCVLAQETKDIKDVRQLLGTVVTSAKVFKERIMQDAHQVSLELFQERFPFSVDCTIDGRDQDGARRRGERRVCCFDLAQDRLLHQLPILQRKQPHCVHTRNLP